MILGLAGLLVVIEPRYAPPVIALGLAGAARPWTTAWRAAEGTALRGALVWAALAIGSGIAAQVIASLEPSGTGLPWTGRMTYMTVLAVLAALVSVLGARNPGGGAWAVLMALLIVVFLIPGLELSGRVRRGQAAGQFRLDSPWNLFYGVLVLAGVTNFLPTRYGPGAAVLGLGLAAEYLGLTRPDWSPRALAMTWQLVALSLAVGSWLAHRSTGRPASAGEPLARLWFWFRDHWGVVWGLRTAERFNRTAEQAGWPVRLSWFGPSAVATPSEGATARAPEQAVTTLRSLLRRFATLQRMEAADGVACDGHLSDRPSG
ncbi:MAG: hypothetical protein U0790_04300 [Isosphaeraceae bacterium]